MTLRLGRAALAVLAAVIIASACSRGDEQSGSVASASCADVIKWNGGRYVGHGVRLPVATGPPLGTATRVGCGDVRDHQVRVARIRGVEPSVAVGLPDDRWGLYVREEHEIESRPLPPALERALDGPRCRASGPFVLEGRLVGSSNLDELFSVSIDVDAAGGEARPYLGLLIDVLVRSSTKGLNERDELVSRAGQEWRLRATVRCIEGDRPTHTFLAEQLERVEKAETPADLGRLHCPGASTGPPCERGAELAVSYPFDLYVHCGLRDAYFDGRWWILSGGPLEPSELEPRVTANSWVRGLIRLLDDDSAEFSGGSLRLLLIPAGADYVRPPCD